MTTWFILHVIWKIPNEKTFAEHLLTLLCLYINVQDTVILWYSYYCLYILHQLFFSHNCLMKFALPPSYRWENWGLILGSNPRPPSSLTGSAALIKLQTLAAGLPVLWILMPCHIVAPSHCFFPPLIWK